MISIQGYRQLFLFLLLLAGECYSFAQSYTSQYRAEKDIILMESFDANQDKWLLPQGNIESGMLVVYDRINTQSPKTAISVPVDDTRDFEVEISAAAVSGILPAQFHLDNYYWEMVIGRGSFIFMSGSQVKSFSNPVVKNSFNKYSIRKSGSTLYYFIDEKSVGSTFYKPAVKGKLSIGFSGKINVDRLQVSYLLRDGEVSSKPEEDPNRTSNVTEAITDRKQEIKAGGKYFALIIGVSKYNEPKLYLPNPEKDARAVYNIFTQRYTFADSNTFLLLNPTRQKIISELYRLRRVVGPNDNLLVFYAGHGFWDKEAKQGYWWAKDALKDDPSSWLSNSDLREQIRSIKSAHTLLISDACFSGGIFRTRGAEDLINASKDIQTLYKMPSRRAITSGTMTVVPDNSVFLDYFLKRLSENQVRFLSSQQLFDSFRTAVINNSSVVPQDGVIAETGDEGGDFIFILRAK